MNFSQILEKIKEKINKLSPKQKIYIIFSIFFFSIFLSIIFKITKFYNYEVLFYGLPPEQTNEVIQRLKKKNIPYIIEKETGSIKVPSDKVGELKIEILAEGIGIGKTIGYEIFDKFQFGITDFEERVKFKRALEGEIVRTINSLKGVRYSRVHIVLPEEDIYGRKVTSSASVLIDLNPGIKLTSSQVQGIVNLLCGSVPELSPENVTVLDTNSNILYKGDKYFSYAQGVHGDRFEIQKQLEEYLAFKVKNMLDKVIGYNKAIVEVSLDLDFNKIEKEEETYLPIVGDEGIIRSKENISERHEGKAGGEGGVVGTYGNVPFYSILRGETERVQPYISSIPSSGSSSEKEHTVVNYEINKILTKIIETPGNIKKMSIGVIVDGKYEKVKEGKKEKLNYIPRTPDEIKQIEEVVVAACGLNRERGDFISVQNIPFDKTYLEQEREIMEKYKKEEIKREIIEKSLKYLPLIIFFSLCFIIFKRIISKIPIRKEEEKIEKEVSHIDLIKEIGKSRPEVFVQVLKKWLSE